MKEHVKTNYSTIIPVSTKFNMKTDNFFDLLPSKIASTEIDSFGRKNSSFTKHTENLEYLANCKKYYGSTSFILFWVSLTVTLTFAVKNALGRCVWAVDSWRRAELACFLVLSCAYEHTHA